MKKLMQRFGALALLPLLASAPALASGRADGVFGSGNTGDMSMQLQFAKSTAVTFLKLVEPEHFGMLANDTSVAAFYRGCRQAMFVAAVRTEFRTVDEIPDGSGYHAFMRRSGSLIEVSRKKFEELSRSGFINAQALTAHVIHEVGHDCVFQGKAVDDRFDPLLDKLGETLTRAASSQALSHYRDLEFIDKVKRGESVIFVELSAHMRRQLATHYLDYIGDWAYISHRDLISRADGGMDRPAPASRFMATHDDSWYLGWAFVTVPAPSLRNVVRGLLQASYETQSLSYYDGHRNRPLPTELSCAFQRLGDVDGARCALKVYWAPLKERELSPRFVELKFTTDILGRLKTERIRVLP